MSPSKSHAQAFTSPVDWSVNLTVRGTVPVVIDDVNWATGAPTEQPARADRAAAITTRTSAGLAISSIYPNVSRRAGRPRGAIARPPVGKGGFEPPRLAAHDPKSCSSANSDTSPRSKCGSYVNQCCALLEAMPARPTHLSTTESLSASRSGAASPHTISFYATALKGPKVLPVDTLKVQAVRLRSSRAGTGKGGTTGKRGTHKGWDGIAFRRSSTGERALLGPRRWSMLGRRRQ
jgi:hypothetical protein